MMADMDDPVSRNRQESPPPRVIVRSAAERRAEIEANAARLGIDDAFVDLLVETFYGRIRADEVLGPIFNGAIGNNWPTHLSTMKDFWASVAMNAGRYSGKPVPAHMKHRSIEKEHFARWLGLFRATLDDIAPSPETTTYFMERAERIAKSLQLALFGIPGLERPPAASEH